MLELEHGFRIVDVHARLTPDERVGVRGRAVLPDHLEREMHQAGIVKAVVFPGPTAETSYVSANNGVARLSVDRPFVPFARINGADAPHHTRSGRIRNVVSRRKEWHTTPDDVERYAYDDRFHGFVLDPGVDGYPDDEVIAQLEAVGLPLLVHGGVDAPPSTLAEMLLEHSFPIIVAHFGGYPLNQPLMEEMIDLLEEYDGCYLDTSYVKHRAPLERALLEHPDRVFFGSGAPTCHPDVAIMEILTLDVSEDKLWRAFSKNACRVIEGLGPD